MRLLIMSIKYFGAIITLQVNSNGPYFALQLLTVDRLYSKKIKINSINLLPT